MYKSQELRVSEKCRHKNQVKNSSEMSGGKVEYKVVNKDKVQCFVCMKL